MSILLNILWLFYNLLIIGNKSTKEISYRGISITWRRLPSIKSDVISLEIILSISLTDKISNLCDFHHSKFYKIDDKFGIECIDSWDNCISWPFHILYIECQSKIHDYPQTMIFNKINLSLPSIFNSSNIYYKFRFPSLNCSCYWYNIDSSENQIELISYLNLIEIEKLNSPPIARFPEHIYINFNEDLIYSLEIFDPDEDLFHCYLLSSLISSIIIQENCILIIKANSQINQYEILIQIEIIEYFNKNKNQIRSRLPYHFIVFIDNENKTDICTNKPLINFLNIENNLIHVALNQPIEIHLISQSQCQIEMDECFILSGFYWKIIQSIIYEHQSQIQLQFQWIPKSIQQCGYHIHCIRCLDQFQNYNDKCINILVYGNDCRKFILACGK
ncbi:unnamed protein product [Adineta steineri]|uniref:Uncharacterized protein n=1 Tax=Adineta steineri TaxID=433720 RepID=A0A815JHB8_9BILA|nr:unnamed protein product [Adineta steineri]CAF1381036.1 unnamed protein product [Adineta steineri]